jgi:GNAT superfamily N-acetyltransferase
LVGRDVGTPVIAGLVPVGQVVRHRPMLTIRDATPDRWDWGSAATRRAAEDGLWSVTCFVVRVGHRRHGVATALLAGAVDLARRHGARVVEAYPVDPSVRPTGSAGLYRGTLSMYLRAGFTAVAEPSASRSVVRLALARD